MMFDSILVKVSCSEELLYLHTISRRHKSPYRFAILRDTLEQLEREPGRQIIQGIGTRISVGVMYRMNGINICKNVTALRRRRV